MRSTLDLLKEALDHLDSPSELDSHPWVKSAIVEEACRKIPSLKSSSPGKQLALALTSLFQQMIPVSPPRQGKRLDSRWGEFGILAARYFAPLLFDLPYPRTLREAWEQIDRAILLFVFGQSENLSLDQRKRYCLIENEQGFASNSTISDWHRRSLERFAALIEKEERRLKEQPPPLSPSMRFRKRFAQIGVWGMRIFLLLLLLIFVGGAAKGWQIYQTWQIIQESADSLSGFQLDSSTKLSPEKVQHIQEAAAEVTTLRQALETMREQASPFLSYAPYLHWLPVYGGDISQSAYLLDTALYLATAIDETLQVLSPLLLPLAEKGSAYNVMDALSGIDHTRFIQAQTALSYAQAARQRIRPEDLSPSTRALLQKVDQGLTLLEPLLTDEMLDLIRLFPRLSGSFGNGPQTYLVLAQNEDELRPSGGFLTAVGRITVENGRVREIHFQSSDSLDDFSKPYPIPPWQLREYMRSELFLLRDANWFSDFPTTVRWVKFLYKYGYPGDIAGVITVDQYALSQILKVIGPVSVPGENDPISSETVLDYLRSERAIFLGTPQPERAGDRKQFIGNLASALSQKIIQKNYSTTALFETFLRLLDEKHVLLYFEDPEAQAFVTQRNWDGGIHPPANGDFLMVVDTNVGFNKTSTIRDLSLNYEVDLRDPENPKAHLKVSMSNHTPVAVECYQSPGSVGIWIEQPNKYPMYDCYWSYLRVYTPAANILLSANPPSIPAGRLISEKEVPPHVDIFDEGLPGIQVWGMLLVVPPGETYNTVFDFQLSPGVVKKTAPGEWAYHLKIQKQAGVQALPLQFRILLPEGAHLQQTSMPFTEEGKGCSLEILLLKDSEIEIAVSSQ